MPETPSHGGRTAGITLAVAGDAAAFGLFQSLGKALSGTIANQDAVYRDLPLERFRRLNEEAVAVAAGRISFTLSVRSLSTTTV